MTQEEDREDDDLEDHEVLRDEDEARRFRSPAPDPTNMVGLVCPRYIQQILTSDWSRLFWILTSYWTRLILDTGL